MENAGGGEGRKRGESQSDLGRVRSEASRLVGRSNALRGWFFVEKRRITDRR